MSPVAWRLGWAKALGIYGAVIALFVLLGTRPAMTPLLWGLIGALLGLTITAFAWPTRVLLEEGGIRLRRYGLARFISYRSIASINTVERLGTGIGQLATELGQRGVARRVRLQVVLGHGVERPVAEEQRQLGEVVAQRIDLPPDEHVGVNPDARSGVESRSSGEEGCGIDRLASRGPDGELVEEALHLPELHDPTALRPNTSASMEPALRLSPTSTSNSGMWSSHSTRDGTGPKRATAIR